MADYRVVPYSKENLLNTFTELAGARRDDVDDKLHSTYFPEYFNYLSTKTIVVEFDYVDRDYLELLFPLNAPPMRRFSERWAASEGPFASYAPLRPSASGP